MDAAMERLRWPLRFIMAAVLSLPAGSARAADAALVAAAKNEGEVVWYTTQIISQLVRPVSAAFEKKYGIKVRSTRANSTELSVKIINESRAGKPQSDVFDGTSTVVPLKKEGYVLRWLPDPAEAYPAQYKDPEGYWVANNLFFLTPGFNTSLVAKGAEPRSYQALLAPKWRGKMAWSTTPSNSGGPGFIGTVLTEMGNEKGMAYLRALSQQQIANVGSAAREVLDQVIAGEYALGLQIFNHHAVISAKKGAPVDDFGAQRCAAPPCGQAARRFHHLAGGPAHLPRGRVSAGGPRGARADAVAQAGRRFVPHAFLHAGADRGRYGHMEEGLRRLVSVNAGTCVHSFRSRNAASLRNTWE